MKKYFAVFLLSFKMQVTWRFDVWMTLLATGGRVLAAWILWGAVFWNREMVAGFRFEEMLSYYLISSLLVSLDMSGRISEEVSYRVRAGQFSGLMVMPINPQGYFGAMAAGESAFHSLLSLPAVAICGALLRAELALTASPMQIICAVLMILMGLWLMAGFNYFLGILAFKFQNVDGILHVKGNLIAFVTGALVPLSLLPEGVVGAMRFLPFYYVSYQPAMILIGKGEKEAALGLMVLTAWTAAFLMINHWCYRHLRVKYDGVGI